MTPTASRTIPECHCYRGHLVMRQEVGRHGVSSQLPLAPTVSHGLHYPFLITRTLSRVKAPLHPCHDNFSKKALFSRKDSFDGVSRPPFSINLSLTAVSSYSILVQEESDTGDPKMYLERLPCRLKVVGTLLYLRYTVRYLYLYVSAVLFK
jgi:hypothetical protein